MNTARPVPTRITQAGWPRLPTLERWLRSLHRWLHSPGSWLRPLERWMEPGWGLALALALTLATANGRSAHAQTAEEINALIHQRIAALAQTGHVEARYHLGMLLHRGIGAARNPAQAFAEFTAAAQAGHPLAAYQAGGYHSGLYAGVVPVDLQQAERYLKQAAEAGYDLGQRDLAALLSRRGDLEGALLWLEAASRQGQENATAALAERWTRDGSPEKVRGYALMLLLKAKTAQPTPALLDRLAKVEPTLSVDEINRATEILGTWVTGPTPVTQQARSGMNATLALLRDALPPR